MYDSVRKMCVIFWSEPYFFVRIFFISRKISRNNNFKKYSWSFFFNGKNSYFSFKLVKLEQHLLPEARFVCTLFLQSRWELKFKLSYKRICMSNYFSTIAKTRYSPVFCVRYGRYNRESNLFMLSSHCSILSQVYLRGGGLLPGDDGGDVPEALCRGAPRQHCQQVPTTIIPSLLWQLFTVLFCKDYFSFIDLGDGEHAV